MTILFWALSLLVCTRPWFNIKKDVVNGVGNVMEIGEPLDITLPKIRVNKVS